MAKRIQPAQHLWYLILILALSYLLTACGAAEPSLATPQPSPSSQQQGFTPAYPAPAYPAPAYPAPEEPSMPDLIDPSAPISFPGRLVFNSERTGPLQIFTLNGADGQVEQWLQTDAQAFEPSWSPDCQTIAFSSDSGGDDIFKLYTVQSGEQSANLLATEPDTLYWAPAWSPSGDVIAYQNNRDLLFNVCFLDPDGADLGCLDRGNFSNAMPSWSPDGSKLVFTSSRDGDWEIYLTDYPPSGEVIQVTNNEGVDFYPHFSPDGTRIVFAAKRLVDYDIYTMNPDGSDEIQLTEGVLDNTTPTWVGNDQIAFSSYRTQDWELYLMDMDGSNLTRLTYQTGKDQNPAWCPTD